jgi:hypothetical protein
MIQDNITSLVRRSPSMDWVKLSIFSFTLSVIYSIFTVLLRIPGISQFFLNQNILKISLIIHVNLSVYIGMMCIANSIMSINIKNELYYINRLLVYISAFSIILIAFSPLLYYGNPILNNYIPIIENLFFIMGISLFTSICLAVSLLSFFNNFNGSIIDYSSISIASIFIIAFTCLLISLKQAVNLTYAYPIDINHYYEMIFWGYGHLLQFIYIIIIEFIWIILLFNNLKEVKKLYNFIIILNIVLVFFTPIIYFIYDIDDFYLHNFFTEHMKYCGAITILLASCFLFINLLKNYQAIHPLSLIIFFSSLSLFVFGGVVAIMISGTNLTIPAYYHGSIIAISIAIMGYIYFILGLENSSLCKKQIIIYYIGQVIHIIGLAMSRGYGVLGNEPYIELSYITKISMGIIGCGGLISIVAGSLFILICIRSLIATPPSSRSTDVT